VHEADAGYKCTCPSRKFPCKHTLALIWMRADRSGKFLPAPVPEWVKDWLRVVAACRPLRRNQRAKRSQSPSLHSSCRIERNGGGCRREDGRTCSRSAGEKSPGPRRSGARSSRSFGPLVVGPSRARDGELRSERCAVLSNHSQRLVDAKPSGLAGRLDSPPTRLFTLPDPARPLAAIRELGQIHLISEAYRRATEIPERLAAGAPRSQT